MQFMSNTENLDKEPLSPEAQKLLTIIMDARNDPELPAEERLEFMKNEFLKPENVSLQRKADCVLWEFDQKDYVEVRPGVIPVISHERWQASLHTLSDLCRLGVYFGCPDEELDPRAYRVPEICS